jgi:hypothetical protein
VRMTPMPLAALGLATVAVLSGCDDSGSPSPTTTATGSSASTSTDDPVTDGPPPTEPTNLPSPEPTGPEPPDSPRPGEVTVSLPSLPIGQFERIEQDDGVGCAEVAYLGGDSHPIPDGAQITVTAVHFSSDIVAVGGPGCGGRHTCQVGEVAFTAGATGCVLPVEITRDPTSEEPDDEGDVRVTMTMDGAVHCPSAQRQTCDDFVRDLISDLRQGVLNPTFTITIGTSEPEPTSESPPSMDSTTPDTPSPEETTTAPGRPEDTATPTADDTGAPSA